MNTPVSFELAKVLKEKGFEGNYFHYWNMVNHSGEWKLDTRIWEHTDDYIEAPTIADVVMWLYEKHNIWIQLTMGKDNTGVWFDWDIFSTITPRKDDVLGEEDVEYEDDPNEKWLSYKTTYDSMIDERFALIEKENYPSPTEAYEAAIFYVLNNLI